MSDDPYTDGYQGGQEDLRQDMAPEVAKLKAIKAAAAALLAAIDKTNFQDLGHFSGAKKPEDGLDDSDSLDGGASPLTAGHVRRLRAALNG